MLPPGARAPRVFEYEGSSLLMPPSTHLASEVAQLDTLAPDPSQRARLLQPCPIQGLNDRERSARKLNNDDLGPLLLQVLPNAISPCRGAQIVTKLEIKGPTMT